MKVVFTPLGSRGDVSPSVFVAESLRARGHKVSFCATPDVAEDLRNRGFEAAPMGFDAHKFIAERGRFSGGIFSLVSEGISGLRFLISDLFEKMPKAIEHADIVIGSGVQLVAQSVAESRGIPYVHMHHSPCVFRSRFHPDLLVPWQTMPIWFNRVSTTIADALLRLTVVPVINRHRNKLGLSRIANFYDYMLNRALLAVDKELGEAPPDILVTCKQVSYCYPRTEHRLSHQLQQFIGSGPCPVYVGFGSMPDSTPDRTMKLFMQAAREADFRLVVSRGWSGYHLDTYDASRVFFADNEPHERLFPLMQLIVHHGGAGTTSTAAKAGIPQLILPHLLDQYYWAHRVHALGIGMKPIFWRRFSGKTLCQRLRTLRTEGETIRRKAANLGETLQNRDGVQDIITLIEEKRIP